MLIIWGTKVKREPRGTVADHCSVCMNVERFVVTDHYEFSHLYYITVGQGTRLVSTRRCWRCKSEVNCVPDGYKEFLPDASAKEMTLDEVIERTNPPLAEVRTTRQQLEVMASEPVPSPAGDTATQVMLPGTPLREVPASIQDAELREALGRLEAYEGATVVVNALLQKLQGWRGLESAGRSARLQEVNTFIDEDQKTSRALAFLNKLPQSFP